MTHIHVIRRLKAKDNYATGIAILSATLSYTACVIIRNVPKMYKHF